MSEVVISVENVVLRFPRRRSLVSLITSMFKKTKRTFTALEEIFPCWQALVLVFLLTKLEKKMRFYMEVFLDIRKERLLINCPKLFPLVN